MATKQLINRRVEYQMKEIEKHLDSSFDNINNSIDQLFILNSPNTKLSYLNFELQLPKAPEFQFIGPQEFQSKIVQEVKLQINSKIKDQVLLKQLAQENEHSLIQSQQLQPKQQLTSPNQPFSYQICNNIQANQGEWYYAIAFNKDCSIIAVGCNKQIKIFEFKQGISKYIEVLNEHKNDVSTLNFMKKSNQLISRDRDWLILIWSSNNNNQCRVGQTIKGHNNLIFCLILNTNEDLFITSSGDHSIRFWTKKKEWICQQIITDHSSYVYQLSENNQENKVISCGLDKQILIIEYSEQNIEWNVTQKIKVECYGFRICFINNNQFIFNLVKAIQLRSMKWGTEIMSLLKQRNYCKLRQ